MTRKGNVVMARRCEGETKTWHFQKFHIFLNFDFTNETFAFLKEIYHPKYHTFFSNDRYVARDHRVHIFFNDSNPSISNGKLREFVYKCSQSMGHKVVVHVSKREPDLKKEIEEALVGISYYLFFEKPSSVTTFHRPFIFSDSPIEKRYLYIGYGTGYMLYSCPCEDKEGKEN